jgi:hypothetical protein
MLANRIKRSFNWTMVQEAIEEEKQISFSNAELTDHQITHE